MLNGSEADRKLTAANENEDVFGKKNFPSRKVPFLQDNNPWDKSHAY